MTNEPITIVILAAGLGTRMKSKKAKVLHEAGGDTLLGHVIRASLQLTGPGNIVTVVGHQADIVKASVRTEGIQFVEQKEQKGTGHALLCCKELIGKQAGQLVVLYGDSPLVKAETIQRLCEQQQQGNTGAVVVTTEIDDPTGYGRIVRGQDGNIAVIVEQKAGTPEQLAIREINSGIYCFDTKLLWKHIDEVQPDNPAKEYYLTDMVAILSRHGHPVAPMLISDSTELLGINTRVELATADRILRERKTTELMLAGVTIHKPDTVTVDPEVQIGPDSIIESSVHLLGSTKIGEDCRVGTGSVLRDCVIDDQVEIQPYVVASDTQIGSGSRVGPFARFRQKTVLTAGNQIGNFVELKNTQMGEGSKANHLAYLGDASIGSKVNVGAGTITCNFDGYRKNKTTIADGVFVGSNSTLVAPISIDTDAYIAAGSVITEPVAAESLALGRSRQVNKPDWVKKRKSEKDS